MCRHKVKMAMKLRDEYQHLAESPYGRGMDGAVKAGADGKPISTAGATSTALIQGDSTAKAESEAARRAREVLYCCYAIFVSLSSLVR